MFVYFFFALNFQEWVEEEYPIYANGPGYIVSADIAQFIVSEFEKRKLKVCLQTIFFHLFLVSICQSLPLYFGVCVNTPAFMHMDLLISQFVF